MADALRIDAEELKAIEGDVLVRIVANAADCTLSLTQIGKEGSLAQVALLKSSLPPALTEKYAKRKAKKYGSKPNLEATGKMVGSAYSDPSKTDVSIGFADEKIRFHASLEPRSKIPLRDPVSLTPAFADRAAELVADDVVRGLVGD